MKSCTLQMFFHVNPSKNTPETHSSLKEIIAGGFTGMDTPPTVEITNSDPSQIVIKITVDFMSESGIDAEIQTQSFVDLVVKTLSANGVSFTEGSNLLSFT